MLSSVLPPSYGAETRQPSSDTTAKAAARLGLSLKRRNQDVSLLTDSRAPGLPGETQNSIRRARSFLMVALERIPHLDSVEFPEVSIAPEFTSTHQQVEASYHDIIV